MTQATNRFICNEDGGTDVYKPQIAFIVINVHTNPTFVPGTLVHLDSIFLNFYSTSVITCATAVTSVPLT